MRHMKTMIVAAAVLGILVIAWLYFSPYLALKEMKKAALEGNTEELAEYVDFPAVRESLKGAMMAEVRQKMEEEKKKEKGEANPFDALGIVMADAIIGPIVDTLASPDSIAKLLKKRSSDKDISDKDKVGSPSTQSAGTAHDTDDLRMGYEGLGKFVVHIPIDENTGEDLILRRQGLSWKLTGLRITATSQSVPLSQKPSGSAQPGKPSGSTVGVAKPERTVSPSESSDDLGQGTFSPIGKVDSFERIAIGREEIVFPKTEKQQATRLAVIKKEGTRFEGRSEPGEPSEGYSATFQVKPQQVLLSESFNPICSSEIVTVEAITDKLQNVDWLAFYDKSGLCMKTAVEYAE